MSQQFEMCKPLTRKIAGVCHQINTHIVFHALIDSLAALIVTYISHEDTESIIMDANKMLIFRVKHYQATKASKRVRRKRQTTLH